MIKDRNDFTAGILFVAVGIIYGALSLNLIIGSALNMGPGFFPLVLCGLLILLGGIILAKSFFGARRGAFGSVSWRAVIMIPLAIVIFGAGLPYLGLFPAVFVTAFVASLSSDKAPIKMILAVSLSLAILCTLVFVYGVRLHIPVFGSWFGN